MMSARHPVGRQGHGERRTVAVTGIVVSLPLGVVLALGRRSQLPIIRTLSVIFIEFWRGVPLITVLFFATYMLPLFLPAQWSIDALLRALVGVALPLFLKAKGEL